MNKLKPNQILQLQNFVNNTKRLYQCSVWGMSVQTTLSAAPWVAATVKISFCSKALCSSLNTSWPSGLFGNKARALVPVKGFHGLGWSSWTHNLKYRGRYSDPLFSHFVMLQPLVYSISNTDIKKCVMIQEICLHFCLFILVLFPVILL